MKNIAVFVSGGGSNLQSLIDSMPTIKGKIVLVVSSKEGVYALKRAEKHGIESIVLGKSEQNFTQKLLSILKEKRIDLIVLAGYLSMLDSQIIQSYPNAILNIHPSLIPSFCGIGFYGIKVATAMIERGVKVAGATVHFVDEGVDTGAIVLQECIKVQDCDTAISLQQRVLEQVEHKILPRAVALFCDDRLQIEGKNVKIKEQKSL